MDWERLPNGKLIATGIADLRAERRTAAALLVAIGAPRLRALGIDVPATRSANPEHDLYRLLTKGDPDSAHSRYNALLRGLVSFARCAS